VLILEGNPDTTSPSLFRFHGYDGVFDGSDTQAAELVIVYSTGGVKCCCTGCEVKPTDHTIDTRIDHQPMQAFCCPCLPRRACVTVTRELDGDERSVTRLFERDLSDCDSGFYGEPMFWSGTIPIAGETLDLQFFFRVVDDGYGNACWLCMTSEALGATAINQAGCHEITDEQRAAPNKFCQTLHIDGSPAEWTVDRGDAGVYTIRLSADEDVPIENRRDCLDYSGQRVADEALIRNLCGGCGCICAAACLSVMHEGGGTTEVVSLTEDPARGTVGWTGSQMEVLLVANEETGCCELQLESYGYFDFESLPGNVPIGHATLDANPCPKPIAEWTGEDRNFDPPRPVVFLFRCAQCGQCPTHEVTLCCDGLIPDILYANIVGGGGCTAFDGPLALIYDHVELQWIGSKTTDCGTIELRLSCGDVWRLSWGGDASCTFGSADNTGSTDCDLISLSFLFSGVGGVGCCCSPPMPPVSFSFTVTVVE